MKDVFEFLFVASLAFAFFTGIVRYRRTDPGMRVITMLMAVLLVGELSVIIAEGLGQFHLKYVIVNVSGLVEIFLQTFFFIYAIKPYHHRKLVIICGIVWFAIWLLNIIFLQPIMELNTNFLLLESFATITFCLYFIYWLLKNPTVRNIFREPHFWIAALWLLLWSVTFFFWVFVKTLYGERWPYIYFAMHFQIVVNIVVYAGIGLVLWFYPKKATNEAI